MIHSILGTNYIISTEKFSLSKEDLYDRVINLLFIITDDNGMEVDRFMIRSDYMPVFDGDFYSIQRVAHKPDISMTASNIGSVYQIDSEIRISNFYVIRKNGDILSNFNLKDYHFSEVVVQVGYFGMFRQMFEHEPLTLEKLMKNFTDTTTSAYYGISTFNFSNIHYMHTSKFVGTNEVVIKGYLSSSYTLPQSKVGVSTGSEETKLMHSLKGDTFIKEYIEKVITANFKKWYFGKQSPVKVYCSDLVKSYFEIYGKYSDFPKTFFDSYLDDKYENIGFAFEQIKAFFPKLDIQVISLLNGDYLICTPSDLYSEKISKNLYTITDNTIHIIDTVYSNKLPAIYSINYSQPSEITCPFFYWVQPSNKVEFQTMYKQTNQVTAISVSDMDKSVFYIISAQFEFATTEDMNTMTMLVLTQDEVKELQEEAKDTEKALKQTEKDLK